MKVELDFTRPYNSLPNDEELIIFITQLKAYPEGIKWMGSYDAKRGQFWAHDYDGTSFGANEVVAWAYMHPMDNVCKVLG